MWPNADVRLGRSLYINHKLSLGEARSGGRRRLRARSSRRRSRPFIRATSAARLENHRDDSGDVQDESEVLEKIVRSDYRHAQSATGAARLSGRAHPPREREAVEQILCQIYSQCPNISGPSLAYSL